MSGEIVKELVRNIVKTRFEDFDRTVVENARDRIIDVIGSLLAGANAAGCSMVLDLVRQWGGKEESTILAHGGRVPAQNAALANSIMARSPDFEVVGPYIDGRSYSAHVSATTVPTAFAAAEQKSASGKELITALILGDDLTSRIVAASGNPSTSGWGISGTHNAFGATAIAGKLWHLDESRMLNALGIVLNQLPGSIQPTWDRVHAFKLSQGLAASAGIFSVELASTGFTGVKDPFQSENGYFALYSKNPNPAILTRKLGKEFYADSTFKPYPCCRNNHTCIDCVLEIVAEYDFKTEDIAAISVNVSPGLRDFIGQPFEIGDVPQVSAIFGLRYNVANALLRRSVRLEHFTDEFIKDPEVVELAKMVNVTATIPPGKGMAADVVVKMKDGRELSAHLDRPRSDRSDTPLTRTDIRQKFMQNVAFSKTVSQKNAQKALGMLERLEEVEDIKSVTGLLIHTH